MLHDWLQPSAVKESQPPYTEWQMKTDEKLTVTAYQSGKVLVQGANLSSIQPYLEAVESQSPSSASKGEKKSSQSSRIVKKESRTGTSSSGRSTLYPMAGSDEVGTGDFFGPIVVASVIVKDQKTADKLKDLGINDSKAMTDELILKLAPEVEKLVSYSVQVLDNKTYNQTRLKIPNIKTMLAMMHNQAYLNLEAKGHTLPENRIIDQFCAPSTYYGYLKNVPEVVRGFHFETRAESKYPAVAAASVIARYHFLKAFEQMEKAYGLSLQKGAGPKADAAGRKFLQKHPAEKLAGVAKMHFANMDKIGASSLRMK